MDQQQHVTNATAADFPQAVLQRSHEVPVVVDFWAEWCGPCHILGPMLEEAAGNAAGAFELVKVDVDDNQQLAAQFGVQGIPMVIAFRDGAPISQFTGAIPPAALTEWLDGILPSEIDNMVELARDAALAGDEPQAEHLFRQALDQQSDHPEAGTGLASLLLARGDTVEALETLARLSPTPDVERLQAAARLAASRGMDVSELEERLAAQPEDDELRLELATALAGSGEYEPALDHLLRVVRAKRAASDDARRAMLDIFGVLGDEHPLTGPYRRQLASALF